MKYLKLFENQDYSEISDDNYLDLKFHDSVDIEDRFISFLDASKFYKLRINKPFKYSERTPVLPSHIKISTHDYIDVSIYQCRDEYFLVGIFDPNKQYKTIVNGIELETLGEEKCFKCDQIEGLLKLLKDRNII